MSMLGVAMVAAPVLAQPAKQRRLNPIVELLEQHKPVFGLYGPQNRRPGSTALQKAPLELARETVAYEFSDYIFDGSMEHDFEAGFPAFTAFANALHEVAPVSRTVPRLEFPLAAKMHEIAPDPSKAALNIGKQLNAGVASVIFVKVESAAELERGIAAMRFKENGGTRPDAVGVAPALWGMSAKEYRQKADLWPLNPNGELVGQVIVESKEGLKNIREIAAVKGIGVLWPGAGSLRGVFSTTGPDGKRIVDEAAWEASIQQVLAACKEFNVPCGYPANADDIELRMKQGFSVFVIGWGDAGFKAVELGRKAGNRQAANE